MKTNQLIYAPIKTVHLQELILDNRLSCVFNTPTLVYYLNGSFTYSFCDASENSQNQWNCSVLYFSEIKA